jgi:hypothetical protein
MQSRSTASGKENIETLRAPSEPDIKGQRNAPPEDLLWRILFKAPLTASFDDVNR